MFSADDLKLMYNAMFNRKSVRKYEDKPLDKSELEALMQKVNDLESSSHVFKLLSPSQVKGIVSAKAPHFLAVYTNSDDSAVVDAGYKLQQIDLWLSANGYGSCWLGMPHPVAEMKTANGLQYVIMLAFGKPSEPLHRERTEQFKRKSLSEITDIKSADKLLEPVRIAPSATNRQPWFLSGDEQKIRLYKKQDNFIASKLLGEMTEIDMGIALCHLWLSALELESFAGFELEKNAS